MFSIDGGVTKVQSDFSYFNHFEGCLINFAHHAYIEEKNSSFIILNCLNKEKWIGPKYEIKIFSFNIRKTNDKYHFEIHKLAEESFDNEIIRADIVTSPLKKLDLLLVFQPNYGVLGESTIFLADLECINKTT